MKIIFFGLCCDDVRYDVNQLTVVCAKHNIIVHIASAYILFAQVHSVYTVCERDCAEN